MGFVLFEQNPWVFYSERGGGGAGICPCLAQGWHPFARQCLNKPCTPVLKW